MLGSLIRKLFGMEPKPSAPGTGRDGDTATDGQSAPPQFLKREPLLDGQKQIAGYVFRLQRPNPQHHWQASSEVFFDSTLINRLSDLDLPRLTGRRPFLLSLQPESLLLPELDGLIEYKPILALAGDGTVADDKLNAVLSRARSLHERGAVLACPHDLAGTSLAPIMDEATYLTIQAGSLLPPDLLALTRALRGDRPEVKLLALGVDSIELFDACQRLHFEFYQGSFLTTYQEEAQPKLDSQRMVVSQLISHLRRKETDYDKLALIARQDFALTFRLLRYINSAALGLNSKIASLKQAMVYIGREGLYRWLTLLLFYNSKGSADGALRETSLGRARMCEILARRNMDSAACEQAFVTGLLSLADVLFKVPLEKALNQLELPEDIHDALIHHEGRYGNILALTLACENGDTASIETLGTKLGLSSEEVNALYLQALAWAVEYDMGLDEQSTVPA